MIKLFKTTGLVVILLSLGLICIFPASAQAVGITYGQTVSGSIGVAAEKDEFTFSGTSTDKITVRFAKASGNLAAYVELFNPSGTRIAHSTSGTLNSTLTVTGTFKIIIRDYSNTAIGTYSLSLQRVNDPGNATALTFGQTTSGTISSFAEIKAYRFTVNANDTVTIRTAATQTTLGSFSANIQLYDSTGTLIGSASGGTLTKKVTTAGSLCLLITDYNRDGTGTYSLSLQRVNNPGNATALTFGQTTSGTISSFAETKAYSFTVNANDTVTIRTATTQTASGSFGANIELYDSTGTLVGSALRGTLTNKIITAGTIYLLITDYNRDGTGTYSLSLQRVNNPGNATALTFGQTTSGTISSFAETKTYSFAANVDDTVTIRTATTQTTSGNFSANIELYDSTGTLLGFGSGGTLTSKITTAGAVYLLITDYNRNGTGTYEFTLQRRNNPGNVKNLSYNVVNTENLGYITGINAYKFIANTGDILTICSAVNAQSTGTFGTYLELFDSLGTRLTYSSGSIKYTVVTGGTFYLFISDSSMDGTGTYKFILLKGNIACSSIDLVDPQVSLQTPKVGEIIESGSAYAITWSSSDNVGVTFQEIRLSTDSGATYPTVIASSLAGAVKSYAWQIPADFSSNKARIKIIAKDASNNQNEDFNKSDFAIIKTSLPASALEVNYEYDKLNQLIKSSTAAAPVSTYTYDASGNRLNQSVN